jgi:signal transduction histidine kinase
VRLSVLDNGPGLGEAARDHLFEPFFTTKPRGTGLGLYVCHTIAERHGTTIEVASRPGQTRFSLVLPVAQPGGSS